MKRKQRSTETEQLIRDIHAENKKRGWTLHDTAKVLGVSHIYMASLSNGARPFSGLKLEKQRKLAAFLGISMIDFFLMIGVLRREDLVNR